MLNRIRLTRIASITSELDRIADEVQKYSPEIALAIDKISDHMENRFAEQGGEKAPEGGGKLKDLNLKPDDKLEMKVVIKSNVSNEVLAMLAEAGLKEDFGKVFNKGKQAWLGFWDKVKDKAIQAEIKALDTAQAVKTFISEHPNLKWAVLGAIAMGFLVLPPDASAELMNVADKAEMLADMDVSIQRGAGWPSIVLEVDKTWIENLVKKSMIDSPRVGDLKSDLINNFHDIVLKKLESQGLEDPWHPSVSINEKRTLTNDLIKEAFGNIWPKIRSKFLIHK